MKILIYGVEGGYLRLSEKSKERIRIKALEAKAEVVFVGDLKSAVHEIKDAEILFGHVTLEMLRNAKRLKWIQAPISSFGLPSGGYYIFPELAESDIMLTNMSGICSDIIPTHVFGYITCFARDFHTMIRRQTRCEWNKNLKTFNLHGKVLGVIGLGGIGTEVARLGEAFGMKVIATRANLEKPKPSFVEKVWGCDGLRDLLQQSDFVVMCLPDAPSTVDLIGAEELKAMKKTSYLINIGRGRNIDLDALTKSLKNGEIAGAGLDVFPPDKEPLPSDHPLWQMENVIITPHSAGIGTPLERMVDVFLENFVRYIRGEQLLNLVDKRQMIPIGPTYKLPLSLFPGV